LVEDDVAIRVSLVRALGEYGHAVLPVPTGAAALPHIVGSPPDLIVLDLGLPDIDGHDLITMIRSVSMIPIVVATARDEEAHLVDALRRGADDYVVKPFGPAELDARIRAVLRRTSAPQPVDRHRVTVGDLVVDVSAREVTFRGAPMELTPREFDLLAFLAARADTVVTRRELVTQVWRQPLSAADKTIDVHLSWLRRKLGENAQAPVYLHTVRGVGVRLSTPGG
jgi:DNA-binding response OmpR family regulator